MNTPDKLIVCPNCNQVDKVATAISFGILAPIKPSNIPLTVVKVISWIFGLMFIVIVCIPLVFILLIAEIANLQNSIITMPPLLSDTLLIPLLCLIPIFLFYGGVTIGVPRLLYRYVNEKYQQNLSIWQRAMTKYNRLLYCSRCAGVFIEGQNRVVPIEQMQPFLHEIQGFPSSLAGW